MHLPSTYSKGSSLLVDFENRTHLPNLVSPKVVLRLSDRALILFLSFCKLSEGLKYIYMSNKNRERSRRY